MRAGTLANESVSLEELRAADVVDLSPAVVIPADSDAPIALVDALGLPELGGVFSAKALRSAVHAGLLPAERHGRVLYVTRRGLVEWRSRCRVRSPSDSTSSPSAVTRTAASAPRPSGSSETERKRAALAAALMTTQALKGR